MVASSLPLYPTNRQGGRGGYCAQNIPKPSKIVHPPARFKKGKYMSNNNGVISPKQTQAVRALLISPNLHHAAASAGISYSTLRRWLDQLLFQQHLAKAQQSYLEHLNREVNISSSDAIHALCRLLNHEQPYVVIQAAQTLLGHQRKHRELFNIEEKLAEIEETLEIPDE